MTTEKTKSNYLELYRTYAEMHDEKDFIQYLERLRSGTATNAHQSTASSTQPGINRTLARLAFNNDALLDQILFLKSLLCNAPASVWVAWNGTTLNSSDPVSFSAKVVAAAQQNSHPLGAGDGNWNFSINTLSVNLTSTNRWAWAVLDLGSSTVNITATVGTDIQFEDAIAINATSNTTRLKVFPIAYWHGPLSIQWFLGERTIIHKGFKYFPGSRKNNYHMDRISSRIERWTDFYSVSSNYLVDFDASADTLILPQIQFSKGNQGAITLAGATYSGFVSGKALVLDITAETASLVTWAATDNTLDDNLKINLAWRYSANKVRFWNGLVVDGSYKGKIDSLIGSIVGLPDTGAEQFKLKIKSNSSPNLSSDKTLTVNVGNTNRNIVLGGNLTTTNSNLVLRESHGQSSVRDFILELSTDATTKITAEGTGAIVNQDTTSDADVTFNTVKLAGNVIKASDGGTAITLDTSDNVTIGNDLGVTGDLTVTGNDIKGSAGTAITMDSSNNVTVAADLIVGGNDIKASDGATALTLANSTGNVQVGASLGIGGAPGSYKLRVEGTSQPQIGLRYDNSNYMNLFCGSAGDGGLFTTGKLILNPDDSEQIIEFQGNVLHFSNTGNTHFRNDNGHNSLTVPDAGYGKIWVGGSAGVYSSLINSGVANFWGRTNIQDPINIMQPINLNSWNSSSNYYTALNTGWTEAAVAVPTANFQPYSGSGTIYQTLAFQGSNVSERWLKYSPSGGIPANHNIRLHFYLSYDNSVNALIPSGQPLKLQQKKLTASGWTDVELYTAASVGHNQQALNAVQPHTFNKLLTAENEPWEFRFYQSVPNQSAMADIWYLLGVQVMSNHCDGDGTAANGDNCNLNIRTQYNGVAAPFTKDFISFFNNWGVKEGSIKIDANGVLQYSTFTGSHSGKLSEGSEATGSFQIVKIISTEVSFSEPIYTVAPTTTPKDKAVIGVLSRSTSADDEGNLVKDDAILSVGNGRIFVCSEGGNLDIGDYICSSTVPGHGMKQDDDLLHSYTVAKATESVDWSSEESSVKLISCTYHCG